MQMKRCRSLSGISTLSSAASEDDDKLSARSYDGRGSRGSSTGSTSSIFDGLCTLFPDGFSDNTSNESDTESTGSRGIPPESQPPNEEKYSCKICFLDFSDDVYKCPSATGDITQSDHTFCADCISTWIRTQIMTSGVYPVRCPMLNHCTQTLNMEVIEKYVGHDTDLMTKYHRFMNLQEPNSRSCPYCDTVQSGDPDNPDITCRSCERVFCYFHASMHEGSRCNRRSNERVLKRIRNKVWKMRKTRKCPHCRMRIEKNGGCPSMTCRCGGRFCWKCGGRYHSVHGHDTSVFVAPHRIRHACHAKQLWAARVGVIIGGVALGPAAAGVAVAGAAVIFPVAGACHVGKIARRRWKKYQAVQAARNRVNMDALMAQSFERGRCAMRSECTQRMKEMEDKITSLQQVVETLEHMVQEVSSGNGPHDQDQEADARKAVEDELKRFEEIIASGLSALARNDSVASKVEYFDEIYQDRVKKSRVASAVLSSVLDYKTADVSNGVPPPPKGPPPPPRNSVGLRQTSVASSSVANDGESDDCSGWVQELLTAEVAKVVAEI
eukprot:Rmarinus@m.19117